MKLGCIIGILLLFMSLSCAALAADNPKVTLNAQSMALDKAMADISAQAGVQIICDSSVKGTVTGKFSSIELEKLLDVIAKQGNLTWLKLYLPGSTEQKTAQEADKKPTPAQVLARADAVTAITGGPIIVCDATTGKQKVFVEQDASAPTIDPAKLGMKAVYLIAKPKDASVKVANSDAANQYKALEDQRMALLASMTPEQRQNALQEEMFSFTKMDPASQQQYLLDQMNARRNMDPQMQQAYRQAMRDSYQALRSQGAIPNNRGGNNWQGGNGQGRHQRGGNRQNQ